MLNKELYNNLNSDNKRLIDTFYTMLIEWKIRSFIKALKDYSNLIGNAVTGEMRCYFASEFELDDEEYFGDTGVAFYFDYPSTDKDCIIVLTNKQFYDILVEKCNNYIKLYGKKSEIAELLSIIKEKLNI